ncbi:MAG: TonB-dependent receptor [Bacteroidales bacterium]|nr:TonB-dependent receptor [Bacteroidales bacterium]
MKNKLLLFVQIFVVLLLFFYSSIIFAQKASVSGQLLDEKNEPVIGAIVKIENTIIGTVTDIDGKYLLDKLDPGKYTLVFSIVGFITQKQSFTLTAGQNLILNKIMKEDVLKLEEVVVVGYGRRQKRDVTGSIETIKANDIKDAVVPSFDQAIQGRASGVQITAANGVAGAPVKVNIRGNSSISAGGEPLYVIDGIPMTSGDFSPGNLGSKTNALADVNPNDIESIEVLKDAAAAAIYGSRGSNGVIIITTKKGKSGKTKFNAGYYAGMVNPTNKLDLLDAKEMLALRDKAQKEIAINAGIPYTPEAKNKAIYGNWTRGQADSLAALGGTDWIDEVIRTGSIQEANLSATGGNDKTIFYVGGTYHKEKGFLLGNDYERISGRINLDNNATEKLKIGTNLALAYANNIRVPMGDAGGLGDAQRLFPYIPVKNADGTFFYPYLQNYPGNAVWELENRKFNAKTYRTISGIYGDYDIIKDLKFRSEYGLDILSQIEEEYNFRNTQDANSTSNAWDRTSNVINWTANNYFSYNQIYNDIHNLNYTLGTSFQKSKTKGFGLYGWGFSNDFYTSPGNADAEHQSGYAYETRYSFLSYFFRLNYKLNEKYLAGLSIRNDASSRFGKNNRHGWFPALSAGWIASEEDFLKDSKYLSFLKLRASYGFTGNANIGDFAYYGVYYSTGGYNGIPGIVPGSLPNPDLGWEKARQTDLTLDYGLLNNRISGTFTYYYKKTTDMLLNVTLPSSSGYSSILQNVGSMRNNGLEITLTTRNIDKKFKWTTDFNIAFNRNKVLDVKGLIPDAFESGEPGEGRVMVNYPVGQAYVVKFAGIAQKDEEIPVYDLNGNKTGSTYKIKAGQELFYDKFGNLMSGDKSNADFYEHRVACGKPNPDFVGGITNTFSYKGFDFSFLFSFVYGNTIYDDPAKNQIGAWDKIAQRREILDSWTKDNTDTDVPALAYYGTDNYPIRNSSRFLYDASFIRLRSLSFAYNLPVATCKKMYLDNMRIFIIGSNLLLWTKYPGWDPEVLRNVSTNSQQGNISFAGPSLQTPQARTISIGLNIGF